MERMKASDFPQELLDLFHLYVHGDVSRRAFLDGAAKYAVGGLTAAAIFEMLKPNYAWAQQVPKDDKRIRTEYATVPSPQGNGSIKGYLARPAAANGKLPAILVVHENRGLNPYVEDVARRLATANFIAFAPDGLTSVGGYPGDDEKGGALFGKLDRAKMTEDFVAAANWLKARPETTGGSAQPDSASAAASRTRSPLDCRTLRPPSRSTEPCLPPEDIPKIKAAVLVHHGEMDTRLAETWPAYDAALTKAKVPHEGYIYPKAHHGFHNDTTPRYDEAAAKLAWQRTLDWFNKYVRTAGSSQ